MTTQAAAGPRRGAVLLAFGLVYVIWGSTYLAIRVAVETLPTFLMAAARFLISGAALLAWARLRGAPRLTAANWRASAIVGALLLLCGNGAVVWAETRVPSGLAALLVATVPVWMVVCEWLRPGGARPSRGVLAGLALGLVGLLVLVGPAGFSGAGGGVDPVGALVLTAGALAWAAGSVYSRGAPQSASPVANTGAQMLCGGAMLAVAALLAGQVTGFRLADASARSLWGWAYLVTFGSVVGFTAYVWLLANVSSAKASTYAYVNPVVAVLLGWAVLGEPITPRTLVAAAIIVGAVVLITIARARPAAARVPDERAA